MVKKRVDVLVLNSNETITLDSSDIENGLGIVDNGGVAINQGKIVSAASTDLLERKFHARKTIDAEDEIILPGFVDPHTHLVFAGDRDDECPKCCQQAPSRSCSQESVQHRVSLSIPTTYSG